MPEPSVGDRLVEGLLPFPFGRESLASGVLSSFGMFVDDVFDVLICGSMVAVVVVVVLITGSSGCGTFVG